jgi:phage tail tape-measure protein
MNDDDEKTTFSLMRKDVRRHGGAVTGAVVGGAVGSVVPIVGTLAGAIIGGFIGHLASEEDRR